MKKSDLELHDEIAGTCIGALRYAVNPPRFTGECTGFYDVCRVAHHYETKGWYRRAMGLWQMVFDLNDNAYSQKYALDGQNRCHRALYVISESKRREEECY